MKNEIVKADKLLKKLMWERLKYFSLKGALKQLGKLRDVKKYI